MSCGLAPSPHRVSGSTDHQLASMSSISLMKELPFIAADNDDEARGCNESLWVFIKMGSEVEHLTRLLTLDTSSFEITTPFIVTMASD